MSEALVNAHGHAEVGWSLRKANQAGGAPAASASPQAAVSIEHSVLGDGGGGGGGSAGGWQSVEGAAGACPWTPGVYIPPRAPVPCLSC